MGKNLSRFFVVVVVVPLYCRDEMDEEFVLVMAEATELAMVALHSIKAGAMTHLKGLSCHRLGEEWMLAMGKVFRLEKVQNRHALHLVHAFA